MLIRVRFSFERTLNPIRPCSISHLFHSLTYNNTILLEQQLLPGQGLGQGLPLKPTAAHSSHLNIQIKEIMVIEVSGLSRKHTIRTHFYAFSVVLLWLATVSYLYAASNCTNVFHCTLVCTLLK